MDDPDTGEAREKLRLKVVAGNAVGTLIEVEEELTIGRLVEGEGSLANDIEISREHARIAHESAGSFLIEDLGSTNGTFVNGRRLDRPVTLETGDRIELGASALVVQVSSVQPTPPSSDTMAQPPGDGPPEPEPEPVAEPEDAAAAPGAPAPFALRIEVDPAAGQASVSLDESSDEVRLVHEGGRWRFRPADG